MALRLLVLRSKLEKLRSDYSKLKEKDVEFSTREAEIEKAIGEVTEETSDEDRQVIEEQADAFQSEKEQHDTEKSRLEKAISDVEEEITQEEEKQRKAAESQGAEKERSNQNFMKREKLFGLSIQETQEIMQREDVKNFLARVRTCIKEKRAIDNVGLTIPQVFIDLMRPKVEGYSKLISRVNVIPVSGKGRQNIMGNIPEAIWTEACASLNELELRFDNVEVDGYKVSGFFAICNATLEDSEIDLAYELLDAIAKAIAKAVDKAIVYGRGTKMPLGIVTRLAQTSKPDGYPETAREWKDLSKTNIITGTGASGLELFQEIVLASGVIVNDYADGDITWIMNKKTHIKIMVEAMNTNANAAIVSGVQNTMPVVGGDIVELSFIPDNNIVFGYLDMYLLAERAGTQLAQSDQVRFLDDQTVFKGSARYDGVPVIPEAFGCMTITATAPQNSVNFPLDKANDASLESIEIDGVTLDPEFAADVYEYTGTIASGITSGSVDVVSVQDDTNIEIKNAGKKLNNGGKAAFTAGKKIEIKTKKGSGTRTYNITLAASKG